MTRETRNATGLAESFACAAQGAVSSFAGRNFRIQAVCGAVAILLGLLLRISALEWAAVFICVGLVLGGECINTAIEASVDLACPETDPLAKKAKDAAAGGVLIASIATAAVGIAIFVPKILQAFGFTG